MTSLHRSLFPSNISRACLSPWFAIQDIPWTQSCLANRRCGKRKLQLVQIRKKKGFAIVRSSHGIVHSICMLDCVGLFVCCHTIQPYSKTWQQHLVSWKCAVCHCVTSTRHTCCCSGTIQIFSSSDVLAINSPGFVVRWQHEDDKDDNELVQSDTDMEAAIGYCHWRSASSTWTTVFDPLRKSLGFQQSELAISAATSIGGCDGC